MESGSKIHIPSRDNGLKTIEIVDFGNECFDLEIGEVGYTDASLNDENRLDKDLFLIDQEDILAIIDDGDDDRS